jgi:signal transduction histidine kinase/CheY-like chemotaxis protein
MLRLDQAILDAQENQSLAAVAIANEQAAIFYLDWGKEKIAAVYCQDAYRCYTQLGDTAYQHKLAHRYPELLQPLLLTEQQTDNYFTDEFIATISHEFRNPLNGILGMSETLLEEVFGAMNEQQLNAVSTIDRSGWYLLALINNMVDLSKIQVGKLELEITIVTVTELCHSSVTFVQHHAIQKQIQLDVELPNDPGYVAVDFQRMRQVLINLLSQAIDSTPTGGKVKLVVTKPLDSLVHNGVGLRLMVIDTSKEVSVVPSDEPLVPGVTKISHKRIGFGLMLVNPIVELHGGSLTSESTIGHGSCVEISLPASCLVADPAAELHEISGVVSVLSGFLEQEIPEPPLILIVEDNEMNINTISSYLTAKGYRPIVAQDGQSAIDLTQKYRPDLILMDIQMPVMDGLEAITRIRQQPDLVSIPIIALTALAMEGDREKCLAVGANEYLTKPVKLKQLNATIQQFLVDAIDNNYAFSGLLM